MAAISSWKPDSTISAPEHDHRRTTTFLTALRCDCQTKPCVINGARFLAYVEQFLVQTLCADDIVIMNNLDGQETNAQTPFRNAGYASN